MTEPTLDHPIEYYEFRGIRVHAYYEDGGGLLRNEGNCSRRRCGDCKATRGRGRFKYHLLLSDVLLKCSSVSTLESAILSASRRVLESPEECGA